MSLVSSKGGDYIVIATRNWISRRGIQVLVQWDVDSRLDLDAKLIQGMKLSDWKTRSLYEP